MIATAVRDVAGDAVDIETLMPAGTCPGQFDLEPQQVDACAQGLVIRHDMQGFLDSPPRRRRCSRRCGDRAGLDATLSTYRGNYA